MLRGLVAGCTGQSTPAHPTCSAFAALRGPLSANGHPQIAAACLGRRTSALGADVAHSESDSCMGWGAAQVHDLPRRGCCLFQSRGVLGSGHTLPAAEPRSKPILGEASWYPLWANGHSLSVCVCKLPIPTNPGGCSGSSELGFRQVREDLPPFCRLQGLCSSSSTRRQGKLWVLSMRFKVLKERLQVVVERSEQKLQVEAPSLPLKVPALAGMPTCPHSL